MRSAPDHRAVRLAAARVVGDADAAAGTCHRVSTRLACDLRTAGFDARLAAGTFIPDTPRDAWAAGWRGEGADRFGHFWVVVEESYILDPTASQFAAEPLTVADVDDGRYVEHLWDPPDAV